MKDILEDALEKVRELEAQNKEMKRLLEGIAEGTPNAQSVAIFGLDNLFKKKDA